MGYHRDTVRHQATYEIHAIASTGDETDVAYGVERAQFIKWKGLVHEMDGHEIHGAEATVNPADELIDR